MIGRKRARNWHERSDLTNDDGCASDCYNKCGMASSSDDDSDGVEQTAIDALATLQPLELNRIASVRQRVNGRSRRKR
jgi:hypothetical protein